MAEFTVNQRFDPYKNMKFRIKWDGKYVIEPDSRQSQPGTASTQLYRFGPEQPGRPALPRVPEAEGSDGKPGYHSKVTLIS